MSKTDETTLRHLRFGWWSLALFVSFGLALETLHGFKVGWYLDVTYDARRLMWTLAHAHGTLLGLLNVAFAGTIAALRETSPRTSRLASRCLLGAGLLLPGGFFLGGLVIYGGDPGVGAFLVPPGAVLLIVASVATARGIR